MVVLSSHAQDVCCSQPMIVQVNSDGTHSVLINVHNTPLYIDSQSGATSMLPCNTVFTYDFASSSAEQPDFSFGSPTKTNQNLSRKPTVRTHQDRSLGNPNSTGINLIHTHAPTYQLIIKETEQGSDSTITDQTR